MFHPNVDPKTGEISLDVLKERWYPEMTLLTLLTALMALLIKPQPWYPRNEEAGMLYVHDYFEYRAKAQQWTRQYAQSLDFHPLPFSSKGKKSSHTEKKDKLDLHDYFAWKVRPKQKKQYKKPTMDDFKQDIKFKWRFVLSIPT